MHNLKYYLSLITTILLFTACSDIGIYFENPQPEHKQIISKIPEKFLGEYKMLDKTLLMANFHEVIERKSDAGNFESLEQKLSVKSNFVLNEIQGKAIIYLNEIEDEFDLVETPSSLMDSLILAQFDSPIYSYQILEEDENSILYQIKLRDTLFASSEMNQIKFWKHNCFLNSKSDNGWILHQLKEDGGQLKIGHIGKRGQGLMIEIAGEEDYKAPSKKEFNKFLKKGGLEYDIVLERQ